MTNKTLKEEIEFFEKRFIEQRTEALKMFNMRALLGASQKYNQDMKSLFLKSVCKNKSNL